MAASFDGLERDYAFEIMKLVDLSDIAKPGPVPAVGQGDVGRIVVPVPSLQEQSDLVGELRDSERELTGTATVAMREIALLHEFRTRLVADVVTGQVDVRAVAASLPDVAEPVDEAFPELEDALEEVLGESEE